MTTKNEVAEKVVCWFKNEMNLHCEVVLRSSVSTELGCWGMSWPCERKQNVYHVSVSIDQSMRDFVATLIHEMVHVKQWVTDKYMGDGENEAVRIQYELADKLWKDGVI